MRQSLNILHTDSPYCLSMNLFLPRWKRHVKNFSVYGAQQMAADNHASSAEVIAAATKWYKDPQTVLLTRVTG